ncbi:MAG TPA: cysteine desulfurase NifS [Verrucomicrobiae bacterium]
MTERHTCYFDNNATTQVAPEALDAMLPFLREAWGNPSSPYRFGSSVGKAVEAARERVAALAGAPPKEVIFTSCGTESNNAVLHSALATQPAKRHIITTAVEHSSIMQHCKWLQKQGVEVTFLPVDASGQLDLHLLGQMIRPDTALVSVMWANNETGVIFPIEEIAAICRSRGVLFHTDATQAAGKLSISLDDVGADFLTLSAHKLHAPKGVGLLCVRRRVKFQPYLIGGHQEQGHRGGTENAAGIVAFGRAAELALSRMKDENTRVRALRDRLEETILRSIPNAVRNGAKEPRLPNTSNIAFDFTEAEAVLMMLDELGICASSGSACTTGSIYPSHVLTAMGVKPARAKGSVRFSLGFYNTGGDVDYLLTHLPRIVARLREAAPEQPHKRGNVFA